MIAHILHYFSYQGDLIFDPNAISGLSKEDYLRFLSNLFKLAHQNAKKSTLLALINADWPQARRTYASEGGIFKVPGPERKTVEAGSVS